MRILRDGLEGPIWQMTICGSSSGEVFFFFRHLRPGAIVILKLIEFASPKLPGPPQPESIEQSWLKKKHVQKKSSFSFHGNFCPLGFCWGFSWTPPFKVAEARAPLSCFFFSPKSRVGLFSTCYPTHTCWVRIIDLHHVGQTVHPG